jgi:hypothetical protein
MRGKGEVQSEKPIDKPQVTPKLDDLNSRMGILSLSKVKIPVFRREMKAAQSALDKVYLLKKKIFTQDNWELKLPSQVTDKEKKAQQDRANAEKLIVKLLFEAQEHIVKAEAIALRHKEEDSPELQSFETGKYKNPKKISGKERHPGFNWVEVDKIWHVKEKQPKNWYVEKMHGAEIFIRNKDEINLFGFDSLKKFENYQKVVYIISQIAQMKDPSYESFKVIADKYPDDVVYGPEGALNLILAMQRKFNGEKRDVSFRRVDVYLVE